MLFSNERSAVCRGMGLVILASVFWGTVGISSQIVYRHSSLTALSVGFFRLALAFPVSALLCSCFLDFRIWRQPLVYYLRTSLIGAMFALYQVCYFSAIHHVGVSVATLITVCTAPVLVALLSAALQRESLTRPTCAALALAVVGTVLLIGRPHIMVGMQDLVAGTLLALGSASGYAVVTLLGKTLAGQGHPLHISTVSFGTGAMCLLPFASVPALTGDGAFRIWGVLVYMGVVPTALAYLCFFLAMRFVRASTASILSLIEPLTATVLAWFLFDEGLGTMGMGGAAMLLGAIVLLYRNRGVGQGSSLASGTAE
jgi:DME family drug/metabolite transporter